MNLTNFMGWNDTIFYWETINFTKDCVFDQTYKILKVSDFSYDQVYPKLMQEGTGQNPKRNTLCIKMNLFLSVLGFIITYNVYPHKNHTKLIKDTLDDLFHNKKH